MTQRCCGSLLCLGGGRGVVKVLAVWQVVVLSSDVSFLSTNQNDNQKYSTHQETTRP